MNPAKAELAEITNPAQRRGSLAEVLAHFREVEPKGEIVLVVGGRRDDAPREHRNKYKDAD